MVMFYFVVFVVFIRNVITLICILRNSRIETIKQAFPTHIHLLTKYCNVKHLGGGGQFDVKVLVVVKYKPRPNSDGETSVQGE